MEGDQVVRANLGPVDLLDAVVVEVQVLQLAADGRHVADLVVRQVEHEQVGDVEGVLGEPPVGKLVIVKANEGKVGEGLEVPARDCLDLVAVQVELVDGCGDLGWHLSQAVVRQVELHEAFEAPEGVRLEDAVTQLVVLEVQQQQVLQLAEGTGRDPGDPVLAQPQLLQVPGQGGGHLFQLVLLHVEVRQARQFVQHLLVYLANSVVVQVDPPQARGILEGLHRELSYEVVLEIEVMDAGWDDRDLSEVAAVTVEGRWEIIGAVAFPGTVRKDRRRAWREGRRQVCRLRWLVGLRKSGCGPGPGPGPGSGSWSSCWLTFGQGGQDEEE